MNRKLKKGSYTAVLSLIVIAVVIVLNMAIGRLPQKLRQWDMSSTKIYTLGDTTKKLVSSLNKDVTIYVVADPEKVDKRITSFVDRYKELSSHIKVVDVDPVLHPSQVNQLGTKSNTLLVKCDATKKKQSISFDDIIKFDQMSYYYYGSYKETEFDGEGKLTSAISYVANDVQETVYQTEGHGEAALGATVSDMMDKSNLTVKDVNLLKGGKIPADCKLLLMNNPVTDLANDEKTEVTNYLDKGGHLLLIMGYSEKKRPNLEAVMAAYGLQMENGLVADTKSFYQNNPYGIFPTYEFGSDVLKGIDSKSVSLLGMSIRAAGMVKMDKLPDKVTVTPFLETTDKGVLVTADGQQKQGTYLLGAVAEKQLDKGQARLTVITAPDLIDEKLNTAFSNLENLNIFMNAVTLNFDDVKNISIPSKSLAVTNNTVAHGGTWGLLFILVIPLVTLVLGLAIWLKRRRL